MVPTTKWTAAVVDRQAQQNQLALELLLGIAIAYGAIGIANTFLLSTSGRRSELRLLNLSGATRRQIVWVVGSEALLLTLVGIILSALVSAVVLGVIYGTLTQAVGSTPLVLPWSLLGGIIGACALIAVLTSAVPAWV